jgi:hypothetical protein
MSDLADFLLARIAEDEAAANEAIFQTGRWTTWTNGLDDDGAPQWEVVEDMRGKDFVASTQMKDEAVHIARWHPDRVLEECQAKRLIIQAESKAVVLHDLVGDVEVVSGTDDTVTVNGHRMSGSEYRALFTEPAPPSQTLRLLGLPHTDHPEYREEWWPAPE